ncbi:hypothetical protein Dxin01_04273 [Deinococcus xinjiangensis]|uniref:Uncharacterized protein n=1 Tax=Deinococcus xinjiangensis TaxID=457454 RepID=A0ABP9VK54_9DEIO
MQALDGLFRRFTNAVCHRHQTQQVPISGNVHGRLAIRREFFCLRGDLRNGNAFPLHQFAVADQDTLPVHLSFDTVTGNGGEGRRGRNRDSFLLCALHDGFRQRVLGRLVSGGREMQQFRFCDALRGNQVGQGGFPFRQGSSLVEDHGVHASGGFQGAGVLEQHALLRAAPDAYRDGGGCCQSQRIRAGDHNGRHRRRQRKDHVLPQQRPHDEGQQPTAQGDEHEVLARRVREALRRGFAGLSVLHHLHDARQGRVCPNCRGLELKRAVLVHRATCDLRPSGLGDGHGFPADHALVHIGFTADHLAVHGQAVSRADGDDVPGDDLLHWNFDFLPITNHTGGGRGQLQEGFHRPPGGEAGTHLQPVTQQRETGEHGRRLEKHVLTVQCQSRPHRVGVRHQDAQRDQGHHVRLTAPQGTPRRRNERPAAPPHHGRCQDQAKPVHAQSEGRHGPETDGLTNRGVQHDGDGQDQRHDEAPQHVIHHRRAVARMFVMAGVVC